MPPTLNNNAYIDGANLHLGIKSQNWDLDFQKFRIWLEEKFQIKDAYIFLGNIPKYSNLYSHLQDCGFKLIFKPVVYDEKGKPKGNCDADLVLKCVQDFYKKKYNRSILISSDGDYGSLVNFLQEEKVMLGVLSPYSPEKCSVLIKRTGCKIYYIGDQKNNLQKVKTPDGDETP